MFSLPMFTAACGQTCAFDDPGMDVLLTTPRQMIFDEYTKGGFEADETEVPTPALPGSLWLLGGRAPATVKPGHALQNRFQYSSDELTRANTSEEEYSTFGSESNDGSMMEKTDSENSRNATKNTPPLRPLRQSSKCTTKQQEEKATTGSGGETNGEVLRPIRRTSKTRRTNSLAVRSKTPKIIDLDAPFLEASQAAKSPEPADEDGRSFELVVRELSSTRERAAAQEELVKTLQNELALQAEQCDARSREYEQMGGQVHELKAELAFAKCEAAGQAKRADHIQAGLKKLKGFVEEQHAEKEAAYQEAMELEREIISLREQMAKHVANELLSGQAVQATLSHEPMLSYEPTQCHEPIMLEEMSACEARTPSKLSVRSDLTETNDALIHADATAGLEDTKQAFATEQQSELTNGETAN
eukprot:TRINITY_DN5542_c0_g1_i1.p1 TRINITY_DN5542_c0_g1~~TRINITY_DN5542_c0_g1_i1.p1  ORF type:complete len:417 (+),score=100.58 TRINITY_DN5542_c0_g1_i1:102-1352(+)